MSSALPVIGYHAMRLGWCRLALVLFLRRWGIYIVVGALAFGAGSSTPAHAIAGVAAWTVMPIFSAATHGPWLLPGAVLQALVVLGCVWGLRALLWPQRWREAEAALPIDPRLRLRSDLIVVAVALLPLVLLQAAGAGAMLAGRRGAPGSVLAVATLVLSNAAALAAGVALLQRLRRPAGGWRAPARPVPSVSGVLHGGWPWALLLQPLWRGPARRTGRLLALGGFALAVPGAVMGWQPTLLPWMLALLAAAGLLLVTRLNGLSREEFEPLFEAAVMLPLRPSSLQRLRALLCLAPLLPACAALLPGLVATPWRPMVLLAYAAAVLAACLAEVVSRPAEPSDKAARWIFSLVLCLALASEVAP